MKFCRSSHRNKTAGYTLIELLAVVVIIAVLAAIAAPSWLAYATRQRMNAVESDLVEVLKQAQQRAISQRRTVLVQIDTVQDTPTVRVDSFSQQLGPNDLPPDAITLDVANIVNIISFDYQGTMRGQEANIPFVVNIEPSTGTQRQCVIIATILGNVTATTDGSQCDNPAL